MSEQTKCELCGEPMPEGEQMFKYHGYSGPCPKPPLPIHDERASEKQRAIALADRLLDEPNADPDDDLRVLSRQLLRAVRP
jgi:hypothetical protein